MARFYFHYCEGDSKTLDDEGEDLNDLSAAQVEADEAAREILADKIGGQEVIGDQRIEIADATGNVLSVSHIRDAIKFR